MTWHVNSRLTQTARRAFSDFPGTVEVLDNGRQHFRLPESPWGRLELIKVAEGFLTATATPSGPTVDPDEVPPSIRQYLASNNLRPWRLLAADDCDAALRVLAGDDLAEPAGGRDGFPGLAPVAPAGAVVGEQRRHLAERLAALLNAARPGSPIAALVGCDGIGKRTLAAAAAQIAGLRLRGEIPLRRLLFDGVLEYAIEKVMRLLRDAEESLGNNDLLLIGDAHLLDAAGPFDAAVRDEILLRELVRLPYRLVLAAPRGPCTAGNVAPLRCYGLESVDDAACLVDAVHGGGRFRFVGPALAMLANRAQAAGEGIVPGRLLYLIGLVSALLTQGREPDEPRPSLQLPRPATSQSEPLTITPDEVVAAANLVGQAWGRQSTSEAR